MSMELTKDGRFAYEVLPDGGARLVRCYGEESVWRVPAALDGHVVVEAAPYVFSAGMWQEPFPVSEGAGAPEDIGRVEEVLGSVSAGRPSGPPACGQMVEEVYFPDTLRKIGRYAFYNCSALRVLGLPGTCLDIGGGSFNGSRQAVRELYINDHSGEKSCLKELLSELSEKMRVHYALDGQFLGIVLFPYYYEEAIENTPARILEKETHGVGHRYRYCFQNTRFSFREYDSKELFYDLQVKELPETVIELALWRLRWPYECRPEAQAWYEGYVRANLAAVTTFLLQAPDAAEATVRGELFRWFVRYPVWDREDFAVILEVANRAGRPQEISYIMEEKGRRFPARRRTFTF